MRLNAVQSGAASWLDRFGGPAVTLGAGCVYVATAMRTVQGGDSGELAAMAAHGGVAHPPGYPLYLLWLRLFAWLPTVPTHRAALATALLGAMSVAMLQAACRAWGTRRSVATVASALFASSPLTWRLSTEPEVFVLNVLIALAIVWLCAPRVLPARLETWRVALLGLAAGLGISNHHSIVLLAPLGLYTAIVSIRRASAPVRATLGGLGMLLVGLSPYVYLAIAARSAPNESPCIWGDTTTWDGFLHHFLRRDYGTFQLHATSRYEDPRAQLAYLGQTLLTDGLGFPLLGIAGATVGLAKLRRRALSGPTLALVAVLLFTGPLFALRLSLPPFGLSALVVKRFHLLPLVIATVIGALGLDVLLRARSRALEAAVIGLVATVVGIRTASTLPEVQAHQTPTLERYLRNVLGFAPKGSIILVSSDDLVGGFLYTRCALGVRPDVEVITPRLLLADWYWPRVSARLGFEVEHGVRSSPDGEPVMAASTLLTQLVETGRPVLLDGWFANGLETRFPSYPVGPLIRVASSWKDVPGPDDLFDANDELFHMMELDPSPPRKETWAGVRFASYARPWRVLASAFEREGNVGRAQACRARADALQPR